ncbi:triphosphoribosyl-dephospho-CoA synthase CitG [Acetonema longum]|uniref:Probable 2-(5''-triphosphoribosyl)-3'-dephosphocoenzyme-A synthase n=1 Tax=Acetonema longum DSM 6540 TaxID=1009370 RepID=F7NER2_9FIRM|nr:triphosphoribosyl-dephospho-CoA synthase CitG [Acetonema longum]EGO65473.1 holo-ACP synthase CitX [Acetonema longum DSM 6540]
MQRKPSRQVSLDDVLAAKEQRAAVQAELRQIYRTPVVSITVNMPGNVKYSQETADLVYRALEQIRRPLRSAGLILLEERLCHMPAGPTAILAARGEAAVLKEISVELEDTLPYGRLLDIDVFDAQGAQLSRDTLGIKPRTCFICSERASDCMRARRHTAEEILAAVRRLLQLFQAEKTNPWPAPVTMIGQTALEAMMVEVACTPAPGLVDRYNSGAHQDMDFFTFIASSSAISQALYQCALAGWQHEGDPAELLPVLRTIGIAAEGKMLAATKGVNTQKGLLFLLGVITGAAAMVLRRDKSFLVEPILASAAAMCRDIVEQELTALKSINPIKKLTAGERLYLRHGITGIRGEIAAGLPIVTCQGLPALQQGLEAGLSLNDALVHTLMALMTQTQDTTILNRHDNSTLTYVQQEARAVMAAGGMLTGQGRARIEELDAIFIGRNISPGGSADLLAVTYFIHRVTNV